MTPGSSSDTPGNKPGTAPETPPKASQETPTTAPSSVSSYPFSMGAAMAGAKVKESYETEDVPGVEVTPEAPLATPVSPAAPDGVSAESVSSAQPAEAPAPAMDPTEAADHAFQASQASAKPAPQAATAKNGKAQKVKSPAQPLRDGFRASHPILAIAPTMPPSMGTRFYNLLAYLPWVFLALMLAAQTILTLDARALWFSDEIRHANAFTSFLANGKWFVLEMNGAPYPDKPPLYFWFLRGLYELLQTGGLLQTEGPRLYLGAAAVSGILYLWATCLLGRVAGRLDGRTILAGGIILLSTGFVIGVTHYARMDLLFSTCILVSHVAFFLAWSKPRSVFWCVVAFVLAGLACLVKGPLGIIFPLATSLLFLVWRGKPLRMFKLDVFVGLVAGVGVVGAWLGGVYMETGSIDFIVDKLWGEQVVLRAVDAFHHKEAWEFYLLRVPFMLLPWVLILFCLPYYKILGKNAREAFKASRQPQGEGLAFLWSMALSALLVLTLISTKILIYLLPALPAMALLAGRGVLQLSGKRAGLFRLLMIVLLLLLGIGVLAGTFMLAGLLPVPGFIALPGWQLPLNTGLILSGVLLIVTAMALWLVLRSSRPESILLTMAAFAIIICYPLYTMAAPALDAVMSPKAQPTVLKEYAEKGYYPVTYKVYGGTYTYYAGHNTHDVASLDEVAGLLAQHPKLILGVKAKRIEEWLTKPGCLEEVHRQWIENDEYILLACPVDPALGGSAPAEPTTPGEPSPAVVAPEEAAPAVILTEPAPAESAPGEAPSAEQAPAEPVQEPAAVPEVPETPAVAEPAALGQEAPVAPEAPAAGEAPAPAEAAPAATPESTPEAAPETAPASVQEAVPPAEAPAQEQPEVPVQAPETAPEPAPASAPEGTPANSGTGDTTG